MSSLNYVKTTSQEQQGKIQVGNTLCQFRLRCDLRGFKETSNSSFYKFGEKIK